MIILFFFFLFVLCFFFFYISVSFEATISAMREKRSCGETFNIGNDGEEVTIKELAQRILKKSGIRADISPRSSANDVIVRRCPDIAKAGKLLGYRPRVLLDDGLDRTLSWYRNKFEMQGAIS